MRSATGPELHRAAIVVDGACPLLRRREFVVTAKLLAHGYNAAETRKILGENWLRVMRAVWGA